MILGAVLVLGGLLLGWTLRRWYAHDVERFLEAQKEIALNNNNTWRGFAAAMQRACDELPKGE